MGFLNIAELVSLLAILSTLIVCAIRIGRVLQRLEQNEAALKALKADTDADRDRLRRTRGSMAELAKAVFGITERQERVESQVKQARG